VRVRALDDLGMPLANLQLGFGDAPLGATDAAGERVFRVPGKEGQRVDLSATCPDAYTGPRERPSLLLSRGLGPEGADKPNELILTCESREHIAVVAVKSQPNLPILLHGQPVARTGPTGTAHVMLGQPPRAAPGEPVARVHCDPARCLCGLGATLRGCQEAGAQEALQAPSRGGAG